MPTITKIAPCLWFDNQAEDAARFYTGIFKNSKIGIITRYGEAGHEIHNRPAGSVMTVGFALDGQPFTALNGGPLFKFNEAVSFQVYCDTQEEIDHYWKALTAGGGQEIECGWLKDRYGMSWQVNSKRLSDLVADPDTARVDRVMKAMLGMKKLVIADLENAARG